VPEPDAPATPGHISRDDVARVARLARLEIDDAELDLFTEQLGSILDHAADVEALDLADVPPTSHPYPLENVVRADEVRPCLDRDEVLAEAPSSEAGMFRVPPVLGEAP
jgi:aspartyl-tRNA(Asn)/glutamyl-tRNA(Gln) amidotransferase subunit C